MGEVIIDNSNLKVLKVMACKESWINKYYDQPQQEYEKEQNREPITISNESSELSNKRFNLKWYRDCDRDNPYCRPYCCFDLCYCDCFGCRNEGCSRHCFGQILLIIISIIVFGMIIGGGIAYFITPFINRS